MGATHTRSPLASYRDKVTELIGAGESFDEVEDAIEGMAGLTEDAKAALWLFAFSTREPAHQQQYARALLASVPF